MSECETLSAVLSARDQAIPRDYHARHVWAEFLRGAFDGHDGARKSRECVSRAHRSVNE